MSGSAHLPIEVRLRLRRSHDDFDRFAADGKRSCAAPAQVGRGDGLGAAMIAF
jgi:hypothetical protein